MAHCCQLPLFQTAQRCNWKQFRNEECTFVLFANPRKKGLPDVVANQCSYKISNIKFERRKMFLFQLSNFMCFFRFRFREIYWYPFKEDCTFVSFPNSDFDSIPCHFEPFYRFPVSTQDLQKPIGFQLHHRIRQKYKKGKKRMALLLQESSNPLSLESHLCH